MAGDMMSFDEAMRVLEVSADELERLVAENEIPAIHDGDTVVFKRQVIQEYRKGRQTRPTIILQSDTDAGKRAPKGASTDETVLNIEGLLEEDLEEAATEAPEEIRVGAAGEEGSVLDTGILEEDEDTATFELDADEETLVDEGVAAAAGPTSRAMQVRRRESSPGLLVVAVATTVVLLGPGIILLNLAAARQLGVFPSWIEESLTALNPLIDGILSLF